MVDIIIAKNSRMSEIEAIDIMIDRLVPADHKLILFVVNREI